MLLTLIHFGRNSMELVIDTGIDFDGSISISITNFMEFQPRTLIEIEMFYCYLMTKILIYSDVSSNIYTATAACSMGTF